VSSFNSFYFLHIPKTGGRLFFYNVLFPLKNILVEAKIKELNILEMNGPINYYDHSQWKKEINSSTYISSIFRDPCKHMVSLYTHSQTVNRNQLISRNNNIDKNTLFEWLEQNEDGAKNYQSKHLVLPTVIKDENGYKQFLNNEIITKNNVLNKINQLSLLIKPEDLSENNIEKIQRQILLDLKIPNKKITNRPYNFQEYNNSQSKEIYETLTKKEKEKIKLISNIDCEVYETPSLFCNIE
jgi:hypothetical protein